MGWRLSPAFSMETHCWCTAASLLSSHSRSRPSSSHCEPSSGTRRPAWWSCPVTSCSLGYSTWTRWRRRGWTPPWSSIQTAGWWCPWCPSWSDSGCHWCRGASLLAAGCSGRGWACRKSWALSTGNPPLDPRGTGSGCCWTGRIPGCLDPWDVSNSASRFQQHIQRDPSRRRPLMGTRGVLSATGDVGIWDHTLHRSQMFKQSTAPIAILTKSVVFAKVATTSETLKQQITLHFRPSPLLSHSVTCDSSISDVLDEPSAHRSQCSPKDISLLPPRSSEIV